MAPTLKPGWMAAALAFALTVLAGTGAAQDAATSAGPVRIETMAEGLDTPWAAAILPDGSFLVTERGGRLLHVAQGVARPVAGVPEVAARGQGGLLDVMVPRDFAQSREVFLTFARPQKGGASTALTAGRLSADGAALEDVRVLFTAVPASGGGRHFGSRVLEAPDGRLFLTLGDRGRDDTAQNLGNHNGSILRLNRDGSVPADNPFAGTDGAMPEIWTYGHRNPQGATLDAQGTLWAVEHGAQGGDEINRIRKGANYGWPVIAYGRHYSGAKIGAGTEKPGMEQPAFYWDPSIAPSGMAIYSGRLWPDWRGDIFVGSLKFDFIARLEGTPLREAERIETGQTLRVRDVIEAPDGAIWFVSEGNGAVYRMTPG